MNFKDEKMHWVFSTTTESGPQLKKLFIKFQSSRAKKASKKFGMEIGGSFLNSNNTEAKGKWHTALKTEGKLLLTTVRTKIKKSFSDKQSVKKFIFF